MHLIHRALCGVTREWLITKTCILFTTLYRGAPSMAEYIGPSNAEPGDNRRIIGVTTSTEQPLDGADVVAVLDQMSREAVRTYDSSVPARRRWRVWRSK